jgi:hypothetical protein
VWYFNDDRSANECYRIFLGDLLAMRWPRLQPGSPAAPQLELVVVAGHAEEPGTRQKGATETREAAPLHDSTELTVDRL